MRAVGDGDEINVHYTRLSARGTHVYRERRLADDGRRLTSFAVIESEAQPRLAQAFWNQGLLPRGPLLGSLRKHYFYNEHFTVLAFFFVDGTLAGYYCDIATPLEKVGPADYRMTDLFLDFWLAPGQRPMALDEDEFEAAVAAGVVTADLADCARLTFERLRGEIAAGIFPYRYIRA
jgi:predicted RNA-binding protein associated with RNAse of E/G family